LKSYRFLDRVVVVKCFKKFIKRTTAISSISSVTSMQLPPKTLLVFTKLAMSEMGGPYWLRT
jgi:hypothetical protein